MLHAKLNHLKFVAILLVFFIPLLLSHVLYESGFKGQTQNLGQWPTESINLNQLHTATHTTLSLPHQWHVVIWQHTPCDDQCQSHMVQVDHLHALLRKNAPRVSTAILSPKQLSSTQLTSITLTDWPTSFSQGNWRSIIAPNGDIVLNYPESQPIEDTLKDIKKLMKFSRDQ